MLFQDHMLKFSACYEFVPGYYLIALDYRFILRIVLHVKWSNFSRDVQGCCQMQNFVTNAWKLNVQYPKRLLSDQTPPANRLLWIKGWIKTLVLIVNGKHKQANWKKLNSFRADPTDCITNKKKTTDLFLDWWPFRGAIWPIYYQ